MWNEPNQSQLDTIPRLNETEHISIKDKLVYLHFFLGDSDWYIIEYDGEDLFFCFAIINGDKLNSEWGYTSYDELRTLKVNRCLEIENDLYWDIKKASEIPDIKIY